ncbi:hypothetical protein K502DRAFT_339127 [Neoconidiobolus thromboides FSU 785]|nr:hypothetical protein K502DRAFT_339127 [Neoconidiobolus thromboides FSU 785]
MENNSKILVYSTFFARRNDEMHLNCGDFITVWRDFDDGWSLGQNLTTEQNGVFPKICLAKPLKGQNKQLIIPVREASLAFNNPIILPSQRYQHNSNNSIINCYTNLDSKKSISNDNLFISHTRSYSYNNSIRQMDSYSSSIKQAKISSNFKRINMSQLNDNNNSNSKLPAYQLNFANTSSNSISTPPPPIHSPPNPPQNEL